MTTLTAQSQGVLSDALDVIRLSISATAHVARSADLAAQELQSTTEGWSERRSIRRTAVHNQLMEELMKD